MSGPMWMPMARPDLSRLLAWNPQPVPVFPAACFVALAAYAAAFLKLHQRGDRWPIGRSAAFGCGLLTVVAMTGTGLGGYGMQLFSVHMLSTWC